MSKITTSLFGVLELLPYQVQTTLTETLEFMTDVFQAFDSTETRLQLRTVARQKYDVIVPISSDKIAPMFNSTYNALRKPWALPIWSEAQYVGNVVAGVAPIACDTVNYDLRAASLAFLYTADGSWQVVEIATITPSSIVPNIALNAMVECYLLPLRLANLIGDVENDTTGYNATYKMSFQISDTIAISPSAPPQYLGNDIYFEAGLLSDTDLTRSITQRQDVNDFDLGVVAYRTPWANAQYGGVYNKLTLCATEMLAFKNFIYRRAGRFRAFWLPTFDVNFRVVQTGQITNTLAVEIDNYADYSTRSHLAIQTSDQEWHSFTISSTTVLSATVMQLNLDSALNYDASQILQISYLGLNRLDTDSIEIDWNGNGVASVSLNYLELTP